jgi:transposase
MRPAARSGAPPARPGRPPRSATSAGPSACPPATPGTSSTPGTPCGRTRGNLTSRREVKLAWIEKTHPYLWRAYLLKEGLRLPFQLKGEEGKYALARWLSWASRCRIPEFTQLAKKIRNHLPSIHATLDHGLSNGLIESVNTTMRVITRIACGFHNPAALIGLAMLALGGLRPDLPRR